MKTLKEIRNINFAKVTFIQENGKIIGFQRNSDEIFKLSQLKKSDYVDEIRVVSCSQFSKGGKYRKHSGSPITVIFGIDGSKNGYTELGNVSNSYIIDQTTIIPTYFLKNSEKENLRLEKMKAEQEAEKKAEKSARAKANREAKKQAETQRAEEFEISVSELRAKCKELKEINEKISEEYEKKRDDLFQNFEGQCAMEKISNRVKFARIVEEANIYPKYLTLADLLNKQLL